MRHPWTDSDYPAPLIGDRPTSEPPSRAETVWMAVLIIALILIAGLTDVPM